MRDFPDHDCGKSRRDAGSVSRSARAFHSARFLRSCVPSMIWQS